MTELPHHVRAALKQAEPYAEIADQLDRAIDLMRVVYLAMENPDRNQIWNDDPCVDVLLWAESLIDEVRKRAAEKAATFYSEFRHG